MTKYLTGLSGTLSLLFNYKAILLYALALLPGLVQTAVAADHRPDIQRDTRYFTSPPTAEEMGQHLFPETVPVRRTRSLASTDNKSQAPVQHSVGLPVLFHFGKTTIVKHSRVFLDKVGEMMVSPSYSGRTLIIEGHTDAVGGVQYNQQLSELRALAIKHYLVSQFDIDPLRLFPIGRGEAMLYEPQRPADGINRRVEFLPFVSG